MIHLTLKLPKKAFASPFLAKLVTENLKVPAKKFPPGFFFKQENFICAGYLASFDSHFGIENLVEAARENAWQALANVSADFIVIFFDLIKKKLFVLTSQSGAFPCYFTAVNDSLFLSTDFSWVKENLTKAHLDTDWVLDYLSFCLLLSEHTVLEEVKLVPPATLLTVEENLNWNLTSLVDVKGALGNLPPRYTSSEKYAGDFLETLKESIADRLRPLGDFPFACDLSSGLDVNLVAYLLKKHFHKEFKCYSRISEASPNDTILPLVKQFAEKHDLALETFPADDYYPFSQQHELDWIVKRFYPADHGEELTYQLHLRMQRDGQMANLTGDGGDEVYKAGVLLQEEKFALQNEFFWTVRSLSGGVEDLVTEEGKKLLLSQERFLRKHYFPNVLPRSAVGINLLYFSLLWEINLWPIMPYNDLKMVRFGCLIPEGVTKQALWQKHQEIFLPEQFRPKAHFEGHIGLYLERKLEFVTSLLQKSLLEKRGIVKAKEILANLQKGNLAPYRERPFSALDNVIRLEYFLQRNNIS